MKKLFKIFTTTILIFSFLFTSMLTNVSIAASSNIALSKPVTSSSKITSVNFTNDNNTTSKNYTSLSAGKQWIQIDLGSNYDINDIKLWHYYTDSRIYHDVVVQLSSDAGFSVTCKTVFNNDIDNSLGFGIGEDSEYAETSAGKDIAFTAKKGRYIRIWSNGNDKNTFNQYVEIKAFGTLVTDDPYLITNAALNKSITSSSTYKNANYLLDGKIDAQEYTSLDKSGLQSITIDLSRKYNLYKIKLWHYFGDSRKFKDVIIQLSNDSTFPATSTTTVFNNDSDNSAGFGKGKDLEYAESQNGKEIIFPIASVRYIRIWSNGSSKNVWNYYSDVQAYGEPVAAIPPAKEKIPVLMYHSINSKPIDIYDLLTSKFEEQMKYLNDNGYTTLTLDEYNKIINSTGVIPKKSVLITFDDGISDNYTVAVPILKKYGFHATFFIISNYVDTKGYMTSVQLNNMIKDGFDIGSHAFNHEMLVDYNYDEQLSIIMNGKAQLEKIINQPVYYLSIPYGALNTDTLSVLSILDFKNAFSSYSGSSSKDDNPFALKRIFISGKNTLSEFINLIK